MNYWFELKYTLRLMRKKLGFSALCIFVIAVGIAITIPLIFMAKVTGYGSLPLENGDRFVVVKQTENNRVYSQNIDTYLYQQLQNRLQNIDEFGGFSDIPAIFSDGESAESYLGASITATSLNSAGIAPLLGRSLQDSDSIPGANPVTVLSFDVWQTYYGGRSSIVGEISRINGEPYTVVGVMPQDFAFPENQQAWFPLFIDPSAQPGGQAHIMVTGQIADGSNLAELNTEISEIARSVAAEFPEAYGGRSLIVTPHIQMGIGDGDLWPRFIIGIVITILALVCFTVGNLLSVRAGERISELAVRGALGGTRWRIITQVLVESFLICLAAAILGLLMGVLGLAIMASTLISISGTAPFWMSFDLGFSEIQTVLIITTLLWLLSGLYPAWKISKQDLADILSSENSPTTGVGISRFTQVLVTLEIVVSCFLLILGFYFVITLYNANNADMGVTSDGFLAGRINLSSTNYQSSTNRLAYLDTLVDEIRVSDSFTEITYASALPGQDPIRVPFNLNDRNLLENGRYPETGLAWVSANYQSAMQIDLLEGRFFDSSDNVDSAAIVVIDALFAQRFWPNESAIGKQVQLSPDSNGEWMTVVGVINHIVQGQPTAERFYQSTFYRPLAQLPLADQDLQARLNSISFAAKTNNLEELSISDHEQRIKSVANRVDRDIPLSDIMTLERSMYFIMEVIGSFADIMLWVSIVALLLATVGIYGVVSRTVQLRSKEIGIRRALGSTNLKVFRIFLNQGLRYLTMGVFIGGTSAVLILDVVTSLSGSQSGVMAIVSFLLPTVVLFLCVMVFLASYIPAKKLVAIEPGEALHYE